MSKSKKRINVAILGAAGRDFHNFLVKYKDNSLYDVKFFTQTQIPGISKRSFPKELAGKLYRNDIPFYPEEKLTEMIKKYKIDECVYSYSDLSHEKVMNVGSVVLAAGANFVLLGGNDTMISSRKKVVSVCAVRTGSGKSPATRRIAEILRGAGKRVVAIRHPMPYGDLKKQRWQRFAQYRDLEKHNCTIEEREEYEPWIEIGIPIYAGVDYAEILKRAEKEAEIILWDGGNNDLPFYKPDLHIVIADPHRPGHELRYHPGEANFRMADVIVIGKVGSATKEGIRIVERNAKLVNRKARIIKARLEFVVKSKENIKGKRVIVIEDGPTLTHGEMAYGAGWLVAKKKKANIVSPVPYAVKSIKDTYKKYKQVKNVLPAMGYGTKQMRDLEATIKRARVEFVVDGTPVNLSKLIDIDKPVIEVDYVLKEKSGDLRRELKRAGII